MYKHISFLIISLFIISIFLCGCIIAGTKISDIGNSGNLSFPVIPEIFSEGVFSKCEGIAFNGEEKLFVAGDSWTAITKDRKLSAQFEQTFLITEEGVESLTPFDL